MIVVAGVQIGCYIKGERRALACPGAQQQHRWPIDVVRDSGDTVLEQVNYYDGLPRPVACDLPGLRQPAPAAPGCRDHQPRREDCGVRTRLVRRLWINLWTVRWKLRWTRGITAGVLWMTKESWNCCAKPLVPGQSGAVEIHSPLKTGADPGGDSGERTGIRATGASDGHPVGGGRSGSAGQPSNRLAERRGAVRGPCISYMEGPRSIVSQVARSRQHRHVAPPSGRRRHAATRRGGWPAIRGRSATAYASDPGSPFSASTT
jgi:hypothetical protein